MSTETMTAAPTTATPPPARAAIAALVRRGLRDNRRAALIWGCGLGIMSAFEVALYPSISKTLGKAIGGYPSGVKEAFGISDFGTIEAYLHAEMYSLVLPFALAYVALRCVATAIAGAEERGHLDSILAVPVARRTLIASAFATAAITAAVVLLVNGAFTAVAGLITGDAVGTGHLAAGLTGVWALALFFAGCATLASGLLHRSGQVLGAVGGVLGAMYLFDLVGKLSGAVDVLRWASAFRYLGTPLQTGLDGPGFAVLLVASAALAVAGTLCFERRDLTG
jgi:ABC-2 type transport system permease protein